MIYFAKKRIAEGVSIPDWTFLISVIFSFLCYFVSVGFYVIVILWSCLMFYFHVFHLLIGLSCVSNSLLFPQVGDFSFFIQYLGIQSCLRLHFRCVLLRVHFFGSILMGMSLVAFISVTN